MLTMYYGKREEQSKPIFEHIPGTFRIYYNPEWMKNKLSISILEDIERVKVESPYCFKHYAYGQISPFMISTGVQHLLMMLNCDDIRDEFMFDCAFFGDNCVPYVQRIARLYDIDLFVDRSLKWDKEYSFNNPVFSNFSKKKLNTAVDCIYDKCDWEDACYELERSQN